jgi:16S rRNA (adenine1518-N6/adenine1519-N6)-dimethyltransferase
MSRQKTVNAVREREVRGASQSGRKPKLGQHFLRERSVAQRIVEALGDVQQRTVVEIGPGEGVLTELLAVRAGQVIAVELDRVLAAQLSMKFARLQNVEIVEANILDVSLAGLLRRRTQPLAGVSPAAVTPRVDVIGNLPYYITSDILLHLFAQHEWIERIIIMVQKEVAVRLAAQPGSRDYGLLSATAQLHARVERLFDVAPNAFAPPPKVHSSVVRLTIAPRWQELGISLREFVDFLKLSFAQKRKTLSNNLRGRYSHDAVGSALRAAGARSDARAEALSLEKMAAIFRALTISGTPT